MSISPVYDLARTLQGEPSAVHQVYRLWPSLSRGDLHDASVEDLKDSGMIYILLDIVTTRMPLGPVDEVDPIIGVYSYILDLLKYRMKLMLGMPHLKSCLRDKFGPIVAEGSRIVRHRDPVRDHLWCLNAASQTVFALVDMLTLEGFENDQEFLLSFNLDDLMHIIYIVFFQYPHLPIDGTETANSVEICGSIFHALSGSSELSSSTCQWAVDKFGAKGIANRFGEIFSLDRYSPEGFPSVYMKMISPFLRFPLLACAFVDQGQHIIVISKVWTSLRKTGSANPHGSRYYIEYLYKLLSAFIDRKSGAWTHTPYIVRFMKDLILKHDLVLLLGKALIPDRTSPLNEEAFRLVLETIVRLVVNPKSAVTLSIRVSWRQVLEGLMVLSAAANVEGADELHRSLQTWRDFGDRLQLDEQALAREQAEIRREEAQGLTGCSWLRCPLHQSDDLPANRELLCCARCRKAQYCSLNCQRRDWKDGDHRQLCETRTQVSLVRVHGIHPHGNTV